MISMPANEESIQTPPEFLSGGGEMGRLIRSMDWSQTPLGPVDYWPQSLRTTLSIILNSKFPMFLFWGEDLICFYNDAYRPSLGNEGKHPFALGKKGAEVWPEVWDFVKPLIDQVRSGGEAIWMDDLFLPIYRNGKIEDVYWTFSYSPVNDESGKPAGVFVTCYETTEKVESFRKLEKTNQLLHNLLMQAPVSICLFKGKDLVIEMPNKIFIDIVGKGSSIIGKPLTEAVPELIEENQSFLQILNDVYTSGKTFKELGARINIVKNGKITPAFYDLSFTPIFDEEGKVYAILSISIDVTERKEAEAALEESQKRFRNMADSAPVMIWVTDKKGNCTYLNKLWLEFTGQTLREGLGMGRTNALHPDDRGETMYCFTEARFNQYAFKKEYRLRKWDGTYEWVLDSAVPHYDEQKNFLGYIGSIVNIHQRKLAEQALEETTRRLQIATTAAQVGIWSWNVKTNKLDWSPLHKKMWGYDEQRSDLTYEDWYKVIIPADKELAIETVEIALRQHKQYNANYRIKRADDGAIRWIRSFGQYSNADKGEPDTFTGVSIDITEQKLSEERIYESEERFRTLADQAPMWVWMANENVDIIYANRELLRFLGLSHYEELTAKAWEKFMHPEDIGNLYKVFDHAAKKQKPFTIECRMKNAATGKYEWFLSKAVPRFEQNKLTGFIGTALNINQQKKQFEALIESERRFRTLAETLPQLIWITDKKGVQIYASSRWQEYTGFKPAGKESWEQIVHPDDLQAIGEKWQHSLRTGTVYRGEVRLKSRTGEYRWHSVHGEPIRNEKGNIKKWIGAFSDIHDQKTLSKKLEKLVSDRTKELQRSNEDLQQFAHVASHDLKEPVRKIKTFVSRLRDEMAEQLDENSKIYINRTLDAASRMNVMIDGVLTYSTISALEEIFEPVNLNEVLKSVEFDLELVIQQKGATIRYNNLPTLEGAPVLLHQLFYNLVNNSLKFTKPDVLPVITLSSEIIWIEDKELARIVLQDNGIGFEQEYADQIFGTFTRLHSKDRYEGSGLGLALCKNIVERHGGTITAHGQPNEGASFEIVLPVKR
jgi:hypothetical protein